VRRSTIRASYQVAVRRADGQVLVDGSGALPAWDSDDAPAWQVVTPVVDRLRDALGLSVAVLRTARLADTGSASGFQERLYEAEWLAGDDPGGWRWVNDDELPRPLTSALAGPVGAHQPWYRTGWFDEMTGWIDGHLADAGIHRRGPIRQVRSWGRSSLLELDTDRGRVWAKDVPEVFAHEVRVAALLADVDPGLVPPLLAADVTVGRMLMEHVEGAGLFALRSEPAAWTATLERLAESQRVLAEDARVLSLAGVPTASLGDLATAIPRLLADDDLLLVGRTGGLTPAEAAVVRSRAGEVADAAEWLAGAGIPSSLDHGDFSASQVILGEMGPVILDWSDATITHPFLAAASFLLDPARRPADLEEALIGAYLAPWSGHGDPRTLRAALERARLVLPLHLASLYADRILPGLDQPWEMERRVPWSLRSLVQGDAILPR
jgi:hypothetical protein